MENQKEEGSKSATKKQGEVTQLNVRKRLGWLPSEDGIPFVLIKGTPNTYRIDVANPADMLAALFKGGVLSPTQAILEGDTLSIHRKKGKFPSNLKVKIDVTGKIDTHKGKVKTAAQTYRLLEKCGLIRTTTELIE